MTGSALRKCDEVSVNKVLYGVRNNIPAALNNPRPDTEHFSYRFTYFLLPASDASNDAGRMADDTELHLPRDLPYPITVAQLHVQPGDQVQQGTLLLTYSFLRKSTDPEEKDAPPTKLFGTWDSPIEGTLSRWALSEREVVSRERARQRPVLYASEPCKHGIQMGGLCALCGKDMTRCALAAPA